MKKLIFLTFILSLFLVSLVSADMAVPGKKFVRYTFEIENMEDYSDYVFLMSAAFMVNGEVINLGEDPHFYKYSQPYIYAVKKDDFSKYDFETLKEDQRLDEYMDNNPDFIKSNLQLKNYGYTSTFNPLNEAKDILRIEHLDEDSFLLVKDRIIYTYTDGMSETKSYSYGDVNPSRDVYLPSWTLSALFLVAVFISLVALIAIIVLIVRKVRR